RTESPLALPGRTCVGALEHARAPEGIGAEADVAGRRVHDQVVVRVDGDVVDRRRGHGLAVRRDGPGRRRTAAVRRLPDPAAVLRDERGARVDWIERDRADTAGDEPEGEARGLAAGALLRLRSERPRGRKLGLRLLAGPSGGPVVARGNTARNLLDLVLRSERPPLVEAARGIGQPAL